MPSGRIPITTTRHPMSADMMSEKKVYDFVKKELDAGHQAYFVYPRIEELEKSEVPDVLPEKGIDAPTLKSAEQMFPILSQKLFPGHPCALVHSKIDEEEQHRILGDFRTGKVQVLVATSVVEVGVDNPNATCMVIEHAERFGLAALHQLRGRVGRGTLPSFCFLIYKRPLQEAGKARLEALHDTTDGFAIADEDLRLRGPGEMSGIQQSGYLTLGIADPIRDKELLEMAREDALAMLTEQSRSASQQGDVRLSRSAP
jgi:ATP-dependent DNA helicase RecG